MKRRGYGRERIRDGEESLGIEEESLSPIERMKLHGGRARKVAGRAGRGADAMLAIYKDRFTYTFVMKKEVASIHFDGRSQKIFFSGHNIKNIKLSDDQRRELLSVIKVLKDNPEAGKLISAYQATLGHQLNDNR